MPSWVLVRKGADFANIAEKFGISPRLACLIRNRDVIGDAAIDRYLNGTKKDLYDGRDMADMERAVAILRDKIDQQARIRVIGDYDIDGVFSTYIALTGFQRLGLPVDADIPDRVQDGYGLHPAMIEQAAKDGVDTILTCDNGIAAFEAIDLAREKGLCVVVTDHHEVPYFEETDPVTGEEKRRMHLPQADAVVDPKRSDDAYPFDGLCGAAVAFKLMEALYASCGRDPAELDDLLEEVAFATVGDVMDLTDENRILVKEGLSRLRQTQNVGLQALMDVSGIQRESLTPYQIGYVLGPCINASGRLDTAKRALALLKETDRGQAERLAGDLKSLNDSRKEMTAQQEAEAIRQVEGKGAPIDRVLVLYLPDCHESLAGIVAGRIREKYNRPTFVLTRGEQGIKGSGRSVSAYQMVDALTQCQDLLSTYGGHAMAAGLTLKGTDPDAVAAFTERLNENCTLSEAELAGKVRIDMELPFAQVSEDFVRELDLLEPFGKGNERPLFAARNVTFLRGRLLGKDQNALRLQARDQAGTGMEAMYFGDMDAFFTTLAQKNGPGAKEDLLSGRRKDLTLTIAFYPEIHVYKGQRNLQIIITHCQ